MRLGLDGGIRIGDSSHRPAGSSSADKQSQIFGTAARGGTSNAGLVSGFFYARFAPMKTTKTTSPLTGIHHQAYRVGRLQFHRRT